MKKYWRLGLFLLGLGILLSTWYGYHRTFYQLEAGRWLTVWKTYGGTCYLIPGKYYGWWKPSPPYVVTTNGASVDVLWRTASSTLIVATDSTDQLVNGGTEPITFVRYAQRQRQNDSLYTSFDGEYRRFKKGVKVISISLRENKALYYDPGN